MYDGPPWVLHHLGPVFLLQLFTAIAKANFSNWVGASDAVIIEDGKLQGDLSKHTYKHWNKGQ